MKKLLSPLIIGIFVYLLIPTSFVYATGKGCETKCSYSCDCGPLCGGSGCSYRDGKECCPICYLPSCESVGMHTGSCPAGCKDCKTKILKCNCGNDTRECNSCDGTTYRPPKPSKPPEPSKPPRPTNPHETERPTEPPKPSEPPNTPTPIQATAIITFANPSPTVFSKKPPEPGKQGKSWLCLQSVPCATSGECSGWGAKQEHRVLIRTKEGQPLKMASAPTYVFECISPNQQSTEFKCTTGDKTLDKKLIDMSNMESLSADYGYKFTSYTRTDNSAINQATKPESTKADGTFGPYEWESSTDKNAWRVIMSMQDLDATKSTTGSVGALQQASDIFGTSNLSRDCHLISWDPRGIIYDADTLQPIDGVKVTLYVKNKAGSFVPMEDKKWGILANPISTPKNGTYQFFVEPGVYKLVVEKKGYTLFTNEKTISSLNQIKNIYNGGEIITEAEVKEVNILLKRKPLLEYLFDITSTLFSNGK